MSTNSSADTAEAIDLSANDPTPDEVTEADQENFVQPYSGATPIGDET